MAYTNDTKPSGTYVDDPEANLANAIAGTPMGLLLALTYTFITGETYITDLEPATIYSNDLEP